MASKNMLVDLNLNGNELQKAVIQNLAAAPANPKAGQIYYNTVDKLMYTFDGTNWVTGKVYSAGRGLNLNGTEFSVDTSVMAQQSDLPTSAADVNALPDTTKYGATITFSVDSTTYVLTATLKDQDGNTLGTPQTVDLPLESVVVNGSYDATNKKIVLTLQSGSTIDIPVADLINGLPTKLTATNPALTATSGVCTWILSNTLGTAEVLVSVYDITSGEQVFAAVTTDSSTITVKFNSSANIAAGTYKAVIVG